jgi:hypothetical protein
MMVRIQTTQMVKRAKVFRNLFEIHVIETISEYIRVFRASELFVLEKILLLYRLWHDIAHLFYYKYIVLKYDQVGDWFDAIF